MLFCTLKGTDTGVGSGEWGVGNGKWEVESGADSKNTSVPHGGIGVFLLCVARSVLPDQHSTPDSRLPGRAAPPALADALHPSSHAPSLVAKLAGRITQVLCQVAHLDLQVPMKLLAWS